MSVNHHQPQPPRHAPRPHRRCDPRTARDVAETPAKTLARFAAACCFTQLWGILVQFGGHHNYIGGPGPDDGNLCSGNRTNGIVIRDLGSDNNVVSGNYVGTKSTGTSALANGTYGITVYNSASGNRIGPENVVSGNTQHGIRIAGGGTFGNSVDGNLIGITAHGALPLANGWSGVAIADSAHDNILGPGNTVSANGQSGIILATGAHDNSIMANMIGTDSTGSTPLGNSGHGVILSEVASYNMIGPGNVVSGNGVLWPTGDGVALKGPSVHHNAIVNNII